MPWNWAGQRGRCRGGPRQAGGPVYFWAIGKIPDVNNASDVLVLGGVAGDLICDLHALDYPWSSLETVENGNNITEQDSPLEGRNPGNSVRFNAGDYLQSVSDDFCDVGTNDFVFEGVFALPVDSNSPVIFQKDGDVAGDFFYLQKSSGQYLLLVIWHDGSYYYKTKTIVFDSFNVACGYFDRSGSLKIFVNGSWSTGADISAFSAVDYSGEAFKLGSTLCLDCVSALRAWSGPTWIDGTVETEIEKRFYRISGLWPRLAVGTYAPTAFTRACAAYLELKSSGESPKLYLLGENLPRIAYIDGYEGAWYLSEPQRTNLCVEPEDLATTWVPTNCTIDSDATTSPDPLKSADGIKAVYSEVGIVHYIEISPTFTDAAYHCLSLHAKPALKNWIRVEWDQNGSVEYCYFNVSTGAVGSSSAGLDGYLLGEQYWDDSYRFWVRGVAANPDTVRIYAADSDNDHTFPSAAVNLVYVWGVQFEQGECPSSYIPTDGATATRLKDEVTYKGDDGNVPSSGNGRLTFRVRCLNPDYADDAPSGFTEVLASLSDGGDSNNAISVSVIANGSDICRLSVVESGTPVNVDASYATITDGDEHFIECHWDTDYASIEIDGVGAEDTGTVAIPDDLDEIGIGHLNGANQALNFLISDLKIRQWSAP